MKKLLIGCLIVGVLVCACGVGAATVGRQYVEPYLTVDLPDECPDIPVTEDAAVNFITKVVTVGQGAAQTKRARLTITQQELTSFVAIGSLLAEQMQEMQNLQNLQNLNPEQTQQLRELENKKGLERLRALEQFTAERRQTGSNDAGPIPIPDLSLRLTLEEPQICFKSNGQIAVEGYAAVRGRRQPLRLIVAPRASQGELVFDFVRGDLGPVSMPEPIFDTIGDGLAKAILAGQEYAEINEITVQQNTITLSGRLK